MNFRDRWEENEQGERFVFTVEMQRRLSQAGLPIEPSALAQLPAVAARAPRESRESRDWQPSGEQSQGGGYGVVPAAGVAGENSNFHRFFFVSFSASRSRRGRL